MKKEMLYLMVATLLLVAVMVNGCVGGTVEGIRSDAAHILESTGTITKPWANWSQDDFNKTRAKNLANDMQRTQQLYERMGGSTGGGYGWSDEADREADRLARR